MAQVGYPVHRIGVSPAVTLPALLANAGPGAVRAVTVGGAVHDGPSAVRSGLATHCAAAAETLSLEVGALASAAADGDEFARMLREFWARRG